MVKTHFYLRFALILITPEFIQSLPPVCAYLLSCRGAKHKFLTKKHRKTSNFRQKSSKPNLQTPYLQQGAFLPSVRASLNHSTTPCLRDSTMLMLAFGRNAIYLVRDALHTKSLSVFLTSVRTSFNHSTTSCFRDCLFLMPVCGILQITASK